MLTRILFHLLALCIALQTFSQDELGIPKLKTNEYWSIGYYSSANLSLVNSYLSNDASKYGYGGAIEFFYDDTKRNLVLVVSKNIITNNEWRHFDAVELTVGPRFNLSKKGALFMEFTMGGFMVSRISRDYMWDYNYYTYYKSDPAFNFGLSAAIGNKIKISSNTDIIFKLRLLSTIPFNEQMFTYLTAAGGITFNTKKYKTSQKQTVSYASIAIKAGGNNPNTLSQWEYFWGSGFGMEFTYKTSPKIELLLDGNYNKIHSEETDAGDSKNHVISITAGGRFLINESATTAFIEIGSGLYSYYYRKYGNITGEEYTFIEDFGGINIGTGVKLNLTSMINFLLKGNLHFIFSEENYAAPNYLSVQGGIRFNL